MIQRIQSIYLLLAGIILGLSVYLPLASGSATDGTDWADGSLAGFEGGTLGLVHGALLAATAVIAILAIFLFNNRPVQTKLANTSAVLAILGLVTGYLSFSQNTGATEGAAMQVGMFLPLVAVF